MKHIKLPLVIDLFRKLGFENVHADSEKGHMLISTPDIDLPQIAEKIIAAVKNNFHIDVSVLIRETE
jgi:uncharacterized protein (DUF1697 family)